MNYPTTPSSLKRGTLEKQEDLLLSASQRPRWDALLIKRTISTIIILIYQHFDTFQLKLNHSA